MNRLTFEEMQRMQEELRDIRDQAARVLGIL